MDQEQFDKYQHFTEKTIYDLSQKVTELENKLNVITNLLEISKYINQYLKDPNLFSLINDMLIGVLGAKYSTIYNCLEDSIEVVATNSERSLAEEEINLVLNHNKEEFILNSDTPIYNSPENVHSCIGVPINVDSQLIGYILVQHGEKNYFSQFHSMFLTSIGNHIGVAIDNNILQKQILNTK
jgi:GAF domain-containing protein